jgi:hypothetical protein
MNRISRFYWECRLGESGGSEGKGAVKFLEISFINAHDFWIDTKCQVGQAANSTEQPFGGWSKWKPPIFGLERWVRDADWDVAVARLKQSLPRHMARLVIRALARRAGEPKKFSRGGPTEFAS